MNLLLFAFLSLVAIALGHMALAFYKEHAVSAAAPPPVGENHADVGVADPDKASV